PAGGGRREPDTGARAAGEFTRRRGAISRPDRTPTETREDAPAPRRGAARHALHFQRFGDDLGDGHQRVERPVGVLEDHLRLAPEQAQIAPVERSEEHTSELQSLRHLVCRLLLEKKKKKKN